MSMVQPPRVVAARYRLVQQLGQGGMGRVWLAHDDLLHRDVAIKEIVPPAGLTPAERQEMRERTLREARAIARLSHPNVVRIFDVLSTDGDPWIVMEYVRGRSLQQVLATDGPLPVPRAAEIGLGVLGALRAAHRAGVLHRDVKPGNVLLGDDGRVVLTDFGLATVPGDPVVTRTGLVLGSPAYLAPERARDGSAGPEADMWSLGATLYAAVEGHSPYARPSAIATLAALATEPPAPAKQAGALRPVLNGLLRKKPSERIPPAEVERLLLRAAGRGSRTQPGRVPFPGVRLRRPPGAATFAAAAGAAVGAGGRNTPGPPKNAAATAGTPEVRIPQARTPQASTPDAEARDVTNPPAAVQEAESPQAKAADAEVVEVEAADAEVPGIEAPDTKATDTKSPDAGAPEVAAPDAGARAVAAPEVQVAGVEAAEAAPPEAAPSEAAPGPKPDVPSVPSAVDKVPGDAVVPIVPGPRVPVEPAKAVAVAPVPRPALAPRRRRAWWWAAASVAAALFVVLAVVTAVTANRDAQDGRGAGGAAPSAGVGGAGAAARSAAPTVTATPSPTVAPPSSTAGAAAPTTAAPGAAAALPEGWRLYRDRTGFAVAVPEGWTVSRRGTMVYFREPGGGRLLGIDQTDQPKPDPVADWTRQEARRVAAGDWNDYRRVRIDPVDYFIKAADWEFTYAGTSGRVHVINRGFITSPRKAYAIYWSTPDSQWAANLGNFRLIAQSFQPAN
jgi:serine/threonine protein kinase